MVAGMCWVQVNSQASLGVTTLCAILVSIIKQHSHSRHNDEAIDEMEDDRGDIGHVKKKRCMGI